MYINWPNRTIGDAPVWTFATWEELERFVDDWFAEDSAMVVTCVPPTAGLAGAFFQGEPEARGSRPFALYRIQARAPSDADSSTPERPALTLMSYLMDIIRRSGPGEAALDWRWR